jgi:hypothetical protein
MKPLKSIRETRVIRGLLFLVAAGMPLLRTAAFAQCTFSSGSTGADGAFTPTNSMPGTGWGVSNNVVTVTNKSNGIFNFTSVYIETNWTVTFTKNTLNTPVYILASSNVTINGAIDVSGARPIYPSSSGGIGGPGGFDGGSSGSLNGSPGYGPGGGVNNGGQAGYARAGSSSDGTNGIAYGVLDILPMIGGSGGGGTQSPGWDFAAGGGGGAILIASSGTLSCPGTINVDGALGGNGGASGSGGSIRLIANTIQGEGLIHASGPTVAGRIRLEACNNLRSSLTYPVATYGLPGVASLSTNPVIFVTSIAGTNTPAVPTGLLTVPDVYLATNFVNPAAISVSASNITPGTSFRVVLRPSYGTNSIATNALAGTYAYSTGTVSMVVYTDRVWRVNAMIDYIPRP